MRFLSRLRITERGTNIAAMGFPALLMPREKSGRALANFLNDCLRNAGLNQREVVTKHALPLARRRSIGNAPRAKIGMLVIAVKTRAVQITPRFTSTPTMTIAGFDTPWRHGIGVVLENGQIHDETPNLAGFSLISHCS